MFKLPELTYGYAALAPWVSEATMQAHHDHHHQTYVDKLNAAVEQLPADVRAEYFGSNGDFAPEETLEKLGMKGLPTIADAGIYPEYSCLAQLLNDIRKGRLDEKIPEDLRHALINQGGGHFNHAGFWRMLTPHSDGQPVGELAEKLNAKYGTFQNFVDEFEKAAVGLFGSGWVWLLEDLSIAATPRQDLPKDAEVIGLDVWEHAYYLDYKWARADYVKAWWEHVDWDFAAARFATRIED
ncbi:superoxide dismutase [Candidatus Saccharibacteria bacterium]|nr:superoxide dismutase [Candidatus Saccharibacteria bacterium]